jgi:hypothetical protein
MISISCILLLSRGVYFIFVNYKKFDNDKIAGSSKYAVQNVGNLTDFFISSPIRPQTFFFQTLNVHLVRRVTKFLHLRAISVNCSSTFEDKNRQHSLEANTRSTGVVRRSRSHQYNAQICTTTLFIYAGSYMFRHYSAIFRELLDPSELRGNTDQCGGLSYNVVK